MSGKEQRSVEQVHRLLGALGLRDARVRPDRPPRPDVFAEIGDQRIAIETTDYHGDEMSHGGSAIRRQERHDAAAGRVQAYAIPANPLHGVVSRIQAKVSKHYELSGVDEAWLALFAGVPQSGAVAATFLVTVFLNSQQLAFHTASMLEASIFNRSYILCELTAGGRPALFAWQRGRTWSEL